MSGLLRKRSTSLIHHSLISPIYYPFSVLPPASYPAALFSTRRPPCVELKARNPLFEGRTISGSLDRWKKAGIKDETREYSGGKGRDALLRHGSSRGDASEHNDWYGLTT